MTNQEFSNEIQKMERFYDKSLTSEQKTIWYESLKDIGLTRFKYLIGEIYRTSKFFPSLSDFISLDRETGYLPPKEVLNTKVDCEICEGRGFILYYRNKNDYKYTFVAKCNCQNAINYMKCPSFAEVGFTEEELKTKRKLRKEKSKNINVEEIKKQIKNLIGKQV